MAGEIITFKFSSQNSAKNPAEFEQLAVNAEYQLSFYARIPVVGTVAGVAKIACGMIQTIGGILVVISSVPCRCFFPRYFSNNKHIFKKGSTHALNGVANIIAGAFEAIPFIGTAIFYYRENRSIHRGSKPNPAREVHWMESGQRWPVLIGYKILEDCPIHIYLRTTQEKIDQYIPEEVRSNEPHPAQVYLRTTQEKIDQHIPEEERSNEPHPAHNRIFQEKTDQHIIERNNYDMANKLARRANYNSQPTNCLKNLSRQLKPLLRS